MKPHDYQHRGADFAVSKGCSFQEADTGVGKTLISLLAINKMKIPALVFTPNALSANVTWPDEIKKWMPHLSYAVLHGPKKNAQLKRNVHIYIMPYSSIKWFYAACQAGKFPLRRFLTVHDESSLFKDPSTKRFKMLKAMLPIYSPYRINLSATPASKGLHNLWSQYYILDEGKRLGEYYSHYLQEHFEESGPPRFQVRLRANLPGEPNHGETIYNKVRDITHRLENTDYLKMPSLTIRNIWLDLPTPIRKIHDQFKQDLSINVNGDDFIALSEMAEATKIRQLMQGGMYNMNGKFTAMHTAKIAALKDILHVRDGQPVLCAIQFRFEYEMICQSLGYQVPVIYGKVNEATRASHIHNWNAGKLPLLLCHPASLSHSINMQSGGNMIVFLGLPWSNEQYMQLIGRLHRQGQKRGVIVHNILFRNTIEEAILRILKRDEKQQNNLLDAMKEV